MERSDLRRRAPAAEVEEWPGRGHLVHLVEPDRFAHRVGAFARQCFRPCAAYDALLASNKSLLAGLAGRCVDGHDLDALALYTDNPRVVSCATSVVTGFPDVHCGVEWLLDEHDMVTAWWSVEGTHLGTWRGIPPTGRTISARASFAVKVVDGKVADFWICADWLRMYRQLGADVSEDASG